MSAITLAVNPKLHSSPRRLPAWANVDGTERVNCLVDRSSNRTSLAQDQLPREWTPSEGERRDPGERVSLG